MYQYATALVPALLAALSLSALGLSVHDNIAERSQQRAVDAHSPHADASLGSAMALRVGSSAHAAGGSLARVAEVASKLTRYSKTLEQRRVVDLRNYQQMLRALDENELMAVKRFGKNQEHDVALSAELARAADRLDALYDGRFQRGETFLDASTFDALQYFGRLSDDALTEFMNTRVSVPRERGGLIEYTKVDDFGMTQKLTKSVWSVFYDRKIGDWQLVDDLKYYQGRSIAFDEYLEGARHGVGGKALPVLWYKYADLRRQELPYGRTRSRRAEELALLPGVGPRTAEKMSEAFAARTVGAIASGRDLLSIPGVGEQRARQIAPFIRQWIYFDTPH